tara:strand:+ start:93 stop:545 length:453 start_codon:yes stop_codon:yes gene_type:complete
MVLSKVKSLLYPLLFSNPNFLYWDKNVRLNTIEKSFECDGKLSKDCYYNIEYNFLSRYSDKDSLHGKNYDEYKINLLLEHNNDLYEESINQQVVFYPSTLNYFIYTGTQISNTYSLKKNDEDILFRDIDKNIISCIMKYSNSSYNDLLTF